MLVRWETLVLWGQALVDVVRDHGNDLVLWVHVLLVGGQREVLTVMPRTLCFMLAGMRVVLVVLVILVVGSQRPLWTGRADMSRGRVLSRLCHPLAVGVLVFAPRLVLVLLVVNAEGPDEVRLVGLL